MHHKNKLVLFITTLLMTLTAIVSCEQKNEKCRCKESYCSAQKFDSSEELKVDSFKDVPIDYSGVAVTCYEDGFISESIEFENGHKNGLGYEYRKDHTIKTYGTYLRGSKNNDWKLYDKHGYRTWETKKRNKQEIKQRIKEQRECED
ncbi:hypothetical protein N9355_01375 [Crocinitomicaceae bacterium]|nr:hypothetical protein [Crocinitomicaceae bacterium]